MFDINTAINTAIAAAVEQAVKDAVNAVAYDFATQNAALRERIITLETRLAEAALFTQTTNVTVPVDEAKMVEALNSQEWFWEKLSRFVAENGNITVDDLHGFKQRLADAEDRLDKITTASDERVQEIVEQAMNDHCETYDHDQYDEVYNEWGGECVSEFVKTSDGDIEEKINDALRNASFEVSVSI
jgi:hypothetical protein